MESSLLATAALSKAASTKTGLEVERLMEKDYSINDDSREDCKFSFTHEELERLNDMNEIGIKSLAAVPKTAGSGTLLHAPTPPPSSSSSLPSVVVVDVSSSSSAGSSEVPLSVLSSSPSLTIPLSRIPSKEDRTQCLRILRRNFHFLAVESIAVTPTTTTTTTTTTVDDDERNNKDDKAPPPPAADAGATVSPSAISFVIRPISKPVKKKKEESSSKTSSSSSSSAEDPIDVEDEADVVPSNNNNDKPSDDNDDVQPPTPPTTTSSSSSSSSPPLSSADDSASANTAAATTTTVTYLPTGKSVCTTLVLPSGSILTTTTMSTTSTTTGPPSHQLYAFSNFISSDSNDVQTGLNNMRRLMAFNSVTFETNPEPPQGISFVLSKDDSSTLEGKVTWDGASVRGGGADGGRGGGAAGGGGANSGGGGRGGAQGRGGGRFDGRGGGRFDGRGGRGNTTYTHQDNIDLDNDIGGSKLKSCIAKAAVGVNKNFDVTFTREKPAAATATAAAPVPVVPGRPPVIAKKEVTVPARWRMNININKEKYRRQREKNEYRLDRKVLQQQVEMNPDGELAATGLANPTTTTSLPARSDVFLQMVVRKVNVEHHQLLSRLNRYLIRCVEDGRGISSGDSQVSGAARIDAVICPFSNLFLLSFAA